MTELEEVEKKFKFLNSYGKIGDVVKGELSLDNKCQDAMVDLRVNDHFIFCGKHDNDSFITILPTTSNWKNFRFLFNGTNLKLTSSLLIIIPQKEHSGNLHVKIFYNNSYVFSDSIQIDATYQNDETSAFSSQKVLSLHNYGSNYYNINVTFNSLPSYIKLTTYILNGISNLCITSCTVVDFSKSLMGCSIYKPNFINYLHDPYANACNLVAEIEIPVLYPKRLNTDEKASLTFQYIIRTSYGTNEFLQGAICSNITYMIRPTILETNFHSVNVEVRSSMVHLPIAENLITCKEYFVPGLQLKSAISFVFSLKLVPKETFNFSAELNLPKYCTSNIRGRVVLHHWYVGVDRLQVSNYYIINEEVLKVQFNHLTSNEGVIGDGVNSGVDIMVDITGILERNCLLDGINAHLILKSNQTEKKLKHNFGFISYDSKDIEVPQLTFSFVSCCIEADGKTYINEDGFLFAHLYVFIADNVKDHSHFFQEWSVSFYLPDNTKMQIFTGDMHPIGINFVSISPEILMPTYLEKSSPEFEIFNISVSWYFSPVTYLPINTINIEAYTIKFTVVVYLPLFNLVSNYSDEINAHFLVNGDVVFKDSIRAHFRRKMECTTGQLHVVKEEERDFSTFAQFTVSVLMMANRTYPYCVKLQMELENNGLLKFTYEYGRNLLTRSEVDNNANEIFWKFVNIGLRQLESRKDDQLILYIWLNSVGEITPALKINTHPLILVLTDPLVESIDLQKHSEIEFSDVGYLFEQSAVVKLSFILSSGVTYNLSITLESLIPEVKFEKVIAVTSSNFLYMDGDPFSKCQMSKCSLKTSIITNLAVHTNNLNQQGIEYAVLLSTSTDFSDFEENQILSAELVSNNYHYKEYLFKYMQVTPSSNTDDITVNITCRDTQNPLEVSSGMFYKFNISLRLPHQFSDILKLSIFGDLIANPTKGQYLASYFTIIHLEFLAKGRNIVLMEENVFTTLFDSNLVYGKQEHMAVIEFPQVSNHGFYNVGNASDDEITLALVIQVQDWKEMLHNTDLNIHYSILVKEAQILKFGIYRCVLFFNDSRRTRLLYKLTSNSTVSHTYRSPGDSTSFKVEIYHACHSTANTASSKFMIFLTNFTSINRNSSKIQIPNMNFQDTFSFQFELTLNSALPFYLNKIYYHSIPMMIEYQTLQHEIIDNKEINTRKINDSIPIAFNTYMSVYTEKFVLTDNNCSDLIDARTFLPCRFISSSNLNNVYNSPEFSSLKNLTGWKSNNYLGQYEGHQFLGVSLLDLYRLTRIYFNQATTVSEFQMEYSYEHLGLNWVTYKEQGKVRMFDVIGKDCYKSEELSDDYNTVLYIDLRIPIKTRWIKFIFTKANADIINWRFLLEGCLQVKDGNIYKACHAKIASEKQKGGYERGFLANHIRKSLFICEKNLKLYKNFCYRMTKGPNGTLQWKVLSPRIHSIVGICTKPDLVIYATSQNFSSYLASDDDGETWITSSNTIRQMNT